jgi:hypothetical protein
MKAEAGPDARCLGPPKGPFRKFPVRKMLPRGAATVIGGRGFGVQREDMRKLLLATRGKVFHAEDA